MWFGLSYSLSRHSRFMSGQYAVLTCSIPGKHAAAAAAAGAAAAAAAGADGRVGDAAARSGAGSAEQAGASQTSHVQQLPSAKCQVPTLLRRVQNKVRQHTLQAAWANALHAQQVGRMPEALQLGAQSEDGLRALRANARQLRQLIGRSQVENDLAVRRDPRRRTAWRWLARWRWLG